MDECTVPKSLKGFGWILLALMEDMLSNVNALVDDFNTSQGAFNYMVKDTMLVENLKSTIKNINEGTEKFNENMEALKHNFLTQGYFKKLERQAKRELKKQ